MASIRRVPVAWQTGAGGTGVSVFYSPFGSDATTALGGFFNAIKALFPTAVSWSIPSSGDVLNDANGEITGAWTGGVAASYAGTGATVYAAGTGAYVRWQTAGIVDGRRVKGRTFLCPILATQYDTDGTLFSSFLSTVQTQANTLVGTGLLVVWHRPETKATADGSSHAMVGAQVVDRVTSLKTRRS